MTGYGFIPFGTAKEYFEKLTGNLIGRSAEEQIRIYETAVDFASGFANLPQTEIEKLEKLFERHSLFLMS